MLGPFVIGFLLSGIAKDYEAAGHTRTIYIVLLVLACVALVPLVSLVFQKQPFRNLGQK